jgi:hypothetical protein
MSKYKILSSKVAFGKIDDTVDEDAFDGCSISALIEAGHIAPVSVAKVSKKSETEQE